MRVGTKGRYAVVALVDIVHHSEKRPVALGEVAQRQQISLSYLEQLFAMLRRAGLVVASRGPGGGYRLQRPPVDISLAEVFQAVEDASGQLSGGQPDGGRDWLAGAAAGVWAGLDQQIETYLRKVTLAEAAHSQAPETGGLRVLADQQSGLSAGAKLA
jgi:Rrf2 family iron-sulfur cluster assembly transcriptional regulator